MERQCFIIVARVVPRNTAGASENSNGSGYSPTTQPMRCTHLAASEEPGLAQHIILMLESYHEVSQQAAYYCTPINTRYLD